MNYKNKKALVCGMAKSGIAAACLLNKLGATVILQDIKEKEKLGDVSELENLGIEIYSGKNPDDIVLFQDIIVLSPGIPGDLPFIQKAKDAGIDVISEVELAYTITPCPVAAITGTNGKTTTTTLAGEMIKKTFPKAAVVGNIGVAYSSEVLALTGNDWVVAEISSFQMEAAKTFKPKISAVLNISPDHLNRHKTVENYISMKERVFINQDKDDFTILNYEDECCRKMAEKTKGKVFYFSSGEKPATGIFLEKNSIFIKWGDIDEKLLDINELKMLGMHNYENVMAASAVALCAGVPLEEIRKTAKTFDGVEHRIEYSGTYNGVDYYNDSKGTNPDAAIRAVLAMKKPIILIGGGYDKESEYDEWVKTFAGRVKKIVLIGQTADKIAMCCDKYKFFEYVKSESFDECLEICRKTAEDGDCVLLSPACASWGMFENYEQRGDIFKEIIKKF